MSDQAFIFVLAQLCAFQGFLVYARTWRPVPAKDGTEVLTYGLTACCFAMAFLLLIPIAHAGI